LEVGGSREVAEWLDAQASRAIERLAVLCGDPHRNRGIQATFEHIVLLFAQAMIFHFAARALRSVV